jgi:hypothetical protein
VSIRDALSEPKLLVRVHFWGIWFWLAVAVVAWLTGWINSTAFVSVLSIVALSLAHWAAYQAARGELRQQESEGRPE